MTELEALLDSTRQVIIGDIVRAQRYKPGLLRGVSTNDLLGDDGMPDVEKVKAAIATAAEEVGATPQRRLEPSPQQGHVGGHGRSPSSWSQALKGG